MLRRIKGLINTLKYDNYNIDTENTILLFIQILITILKLHN
jgi:hypothetical protein